MLKKGRVWILEDDPEAAFVYREILESRHHLRFFAQLSSFAQALGEAAQAPGEAPELVIADLRLPDGTFLEFLAGEAAARLPSPPFLVISSCDEIDVLRSCFEEGAIDYLAKPFTKAELIVKVERFLTSPAREGAKEARSAPEVDGLELNPGSLTVRRGPDQLTRLTPKELQIVTLLHAARGRRVSRQSIVDTVWKDISVCSKTLDVHLFNVRRKLRGLGLEIRFEYPDSFVLVARQD